MIYIFCIFFVFRCKIRLGKSITIQDSNNNRQLRSNHFLFWALLVCTESAERNWTLVKYFLRNWNKWTKIGTINRKRYKIGCLNCILVEFTALDYIQWSYNQNTNLLTFARRYGSNFLMNFLLFITNEILIGFIFWTGLKQISIYYVF
jgi:hypothetical protein